MIGRADIEGSKSNVAMNAWLPQASYPCGNFSDTSSFKFRRTKGSIGHAFTVRIRTGNQNQTSFYPFVPHEISVLVELILGHLRYLLTDVPPQPNSPPDNVFRPDRPAEAGLGSKNRGNAPPPIHGIIGFPLSVPVLSRLFDARGRGPEGPVPNPSPDRHAATRSRRESSSSSPPTADGFGTGTPVPSPQSQSFSRGYGSILPTSLAYIVPSTRGCSPWRPDAVMSTTGRGRHSVLRIFKGRRGRTGHHATCGALPAAGPYLRLSRFQGGQAICTDGRSARAHAPGFAATVAPSYSSGPGPCPDGRVSAQLGTVTQLPVHPASPVLLTKNGPLGALDSVERLNGAATPSYLFKSDERFARQYRCGPPPEFPLASPRSGIVHHLSGPDRINQVESIDDYARRANVATTNGIARPALRQSVLKRQPIYHRDLTRHKHQPTFTACTASKGTTDTCGHVSRYNAQLTQNTRQIRIPPSTSTRGHGRNGSSRHTDTAKWVGNTRTTSEHRGTPAQGVHEKGCMLEVPNHEQGAKQHNHPDRHSHALTRDSDHIQDDAPTSHLNIIPHFLAWRLGQLPEDCMKGLFIITERDKPKRKLPKDALRRVATPCHATLFAYIALEANAKPVPSRPKSTSKLSRLAPLSETTAQPGAKSRNATMPRACIAQDATSKEPVPSRPDRTWGRSDSCPFVLRLSP
ncbi:hypothetical protein RIF29_02918 [Crotalaria pallida]|uniref:Senescence-associated protein n=2 Tax=Crotalaria pallida TaxID=3830 RepID=A0AAN9P8Y6_CROPI